MRLCSDHFDVEVSRATLSAYLRIGRGPQLEAFVSLDDPGLAAIEWKGRAVWPAWRAAAGKADDAPPPRSLTEQELQRVIEADTLARAERDRRQWWRPILRGMPTTNPSPHRPDQKDARTAR